MIATALRRVALRLEDRLATLEGGLDRGDPVWPEYLATVGTYTAVIAQLTPGAYGPFLDTKQMAEKLNVSPRTLLKRKGAVTPAVQLGKRGRAAIRWKGTEAVR
jgi:hypothetical protein